MDKKHKILKISSIVIGIILILVVSVILCISPITKHLIEKYDEQYTGRKITMDWVYVNPFTGYLHFSNLKIYEYKSDSIFISAKNMNVTIAMRKLLSKNIEISAITLNQPDIVVDKNKKEFNFSDIILKFTPKKTKANGNAKPSNIHFSILGIKINKGIIWYREKSVPINYFIKDVNIECPGKRWDSDSIDVKYSFYSGPFKGDMRGEYSMNVRKLNYRFLVVVRKFDLKVLEPYIKDLKNYGTYSADLEANIKAKGNFRDANDVTFTGMLSIHQFHFGKDPKNDFGSFEKLQLAIYQLSPKDNKYLFDSVLLTHPYFKYEHYDKFDNLQKMFVKKGSNRGGGNSNSSSFNLLTTIGKYIEVLSKNFFRSDYKINRLAIYNGDFDYNDYAMSQKFALSIKPVDVISDSIDKNQDRVHITFKTGIKPAGNIDISLSINPKDSGDFDLVYNLQRLPATLFNPYLITYTSYPLNRGIVELNGVWNVRNGMIKSKNHLEVIDPRLAKRVDNKEVKKLPMKLIMSIIRDRGNVIDYQIPITGNLRRPTFHIGDVIRDALVNILEKPVTTPYRIRVKELETDIERSLTLKWELRQFTPDNNQIEFMNKMAEFLSDNPKAYISVQPHLYEPKEKENILLFEARKKYFMAIHNIKSAGFNSNDSLTVAQMSIKDKSFNEYLDKHTKSRLVYTTQGKSALFIGNKEINEHYKQLNRNREKAFLQPFIKKGVLKQVKFASPESVVPFDGYSFYKIFYHGELPEILLTAYSRMNELNNEVPRKAYKKDRKITKTHSL
jgi:hypothetical protein